MKNQKYAIALIILFSIPVAFFLLFMFGEVFSGDISGFGHIFQAAPFIGVIILIWVKMLKKKK